MKLIFMLLVLGLANARCANAQERTPSAPTNFLTTERIIVTAGLSTEAAYDGYTTQVIMNRGGTEQNFLARPFVTRGVGGQITASALGVGAVLGIQYALHKTHHERLVNWIGRIALVGEGVNCIQQGRTLSQSVPIGTIVH